MLNGITQATSIAQTGGSITFRNNVLTGSTTVGAGLTLTLDMGAGNSATYTGGVTVADQGTIRAASGTTNFGTGAIAFKQTVVTPDCWKDGSAATRLIPGFRTQGPAGRMRTTRSSEG